MSLAIRSAGGIIAKLEKFGAVKIIGSFHCVSTEAAESLS